MMFSEMREKRKKREINSRQGGKAFSRGSKRLY